MNTTKPILLIEDDIIDRMTVQRSFKELQITNELLTANNGEEGLVCLKDERTDAPCIIILDLNMPKMNGIEFLSVVKQDAVLRKIPVIVLTTSKEEIDKVRSFNLGVAGYIQKPVDYDKFLEAIKTINLYWTLSELPS